MKRLIGMVFLVLLLSLSAFAETARISTPGGPLRMRKTPSAKGRLVTEIPNHSLVEIEEIEGEWAKVAYKKASGYVRTEYLLLSSALAGKTVYSDKKTLILREGPDSGAPITAVAGPHEALNVKKVSEGWAFAATGSGSGWVPAEELSFQYTAPQYEPDWMRESGCAVEDAPLRADEDSASGTTGSLKAGETAVVALIRGDQCLVLTDHGCGWTDCGKISISFYEDETKLPAEGLSASEAAEKAASALKKKAKGFKPSDLDSVAAYADEVSGLKGPFYKVTYLNDADQVLYAALVDASDGRVILTADYTVFAAPVRVSRLPYGEMTLELSSDRLSVGDVLDISIEAWTDCSCRYVLEKKGRTVFDGEDTDHFSASFRPREEGDYTLTVLVRDEEGHEESRGASFEVRGSANVGRSEVYSQMDGWWADKAYRTSNLGKSGCAVFTLSHALDRMGHEGEDILPERLAKTFALCLTPDGTNNERLIREASQAYGFKTKPALIGDRSKIAELLREGMLFSFSIVRGHIALIDGISEDGTMVHIVDSAPTATFERVVNASLYIRRRSGAWRAVRSLEEIPGARYYFETGGFSGLEYWMELSYAARRGVRLIQPVKKETADGR